MLFALATPDNVRLAMGLTAFGLGLIASVAGLLMLIAGPYRKEAKILAAQSARLTSLKGFADQKGLTDNLTLLTQSATALIEAVNALIRTSSGNAIVLVIVGALFEAAAYWLLILGGGLAA
ncbi:MAG: hypothetical protein ACRDH2_07810 [Anaerolineales bacterium]